MVNLWFTEKDLRYRWSEVKQYFWEEYERQLKMIGKGFLERSLRIEQELHIGAGHYERSPGRQNHRNGYYTRDIICKLGVLTDVLVPRSRSGTYRSAILERYKRFGGDFDKHVLELFSLGLATRRVERFFTGFFGDYGFSAQKVSDLLGQVSYDLEQYRQRPLTDNIRHLYLDGIYVTIRKYVILCALAEYTDGRREFIDFRVATSEKTVHWQAFLDSLYRRGLWGKNLQLIVTDGASGLIDAVQTVYGSIPLQVCWIHRQRNLISHLKCRSHRRAICADVSAIFQADSKDKALRLIYKFQHRWHPKEPRAVKIFLKDIDLSLTFYEQPKSRWKTLSSNNIIERQLRELRRRIKLIDSFRDEKSCERIIFTQVKQLNQKLELKPL
jgi:putative transposase